jgi:predicted MFS family arabinose efflux permease
MQKHPNFLFEAGPLFLVLFIDGMGLGLVFPILNGLIFDPASTFLPNRLATPAIHNLIYGGIIGIFMLAWFFGAAVLGDLSDHIGRKKSLMICLLGALLSYLISAIAIGLHSLTLLLVGRVIGGLTSGSQPIAQAAIIDLSRPENKARNIGFILLAISLGFIIGPLAGGVLSDSRILPWFSFASPFYFAAGISLLNMLLLSALFHETFMPKDTRFHLNPYHAIHLFISAFENRRIRILSITFLIFIFGWSSYYSFVSLFLLKSFGFSPTQISVFMAVMGVGFGISNGYLVDYFTKRFSLKNNFLFFTLLGATLVFLMLEIGSAILQWALVAPLAASVSIGYAAMLTLFSNQVDENSQGWVMGISGAIMAFVFGVDGLIIGAVAILSPLLPIAISAVSLLLAVIFGLKFINKADEGHPNPAPPDLIRG